MAVFVLDDFDMFAAKARQTVLYNLLDCMQAHDIQARCISVAVPMHAWADQCHMQAIDTGVP